MEFLALGGEESGHPVVAEAVDGFVQRWSWGIRTLVQDGRAVAQALDVAGIEYDGVDGSGGAQMRRITTLAVGDPVADLDEAQGATWGEVGEGLVPDFSAASVREAGQVGAEQWRETGADVWDQSLPGRIGRALDGEDPFAGDVADLEGLGEIVG